MRAPKPRPARDRLLPRGALLGAAALVGFALLATGSARLAGYQAGEIPAALPVASQALHFVDRRDGAVAVLAADGSTPVGELAPGTNGFARSVLRGLARERKARGSDRDTPFRLTRWSNGDLTLDDPATGRRVCLAAFGETNAAAFARFMLAGGSS